MRYHLIGAVCAALALSLAVSSPQATAAPDASPAVKAPAKASSATPAAKAPASQPTEPKDAKEATGAVKDAIAAAKGGQWWYFSALVVLLVMFVLKVTKLLEKMGRWKYVVSPILSLAAALLATFQGGLSIEGAIGVFTSSWATGMLEELVNHGIRGQPHENVKAPS